MSPIRTGVTVVAVAAGVVAVASKKVRKRARRAAGVYVQEVSSGAKPINAVGTAVAAFVGFAPRHPADTPW